MIYHVHPINDSEEHELEGTTCKCGPRIVEESGSMIVVHSAFDGREGVELAKEVLKTDINREPV